GEHRVGRKYQPELPVGTHERIDVGRGLAAERAVEIVELHESDVAIRISDRNLPRQFGEPNRKIAFQVEIGDRIALVASDGILVGAELRRTCRRCSKAERHQADERQPHYCDTTPSGAVSRLKAAAKSARV